MDCKSSASFLIRSMYYMGSPGLQLFSGLLQGYVVIFPLIPEVV